MQYDHFYLYDEMTDALRGAAQARPGRLRLQALAEAPSGRSVWMAEITDFTQPGADRRGGYYLQAGVHAQEALGTHAALALVEELLSGRHDALLGRVVFYIAPRINVDGTEYALSRCAAVRSRLKRREGVPNALIPQDIDGDGRILTMRKRDELGEWKQIPGSEAMTPREAGDREGPFYSLWEEGLLENFDGGTPQPGMRNIDFNRSLPWDWSPADHASDYPCRDPETRAVAEFLTAHPNIFAGVDLHGGTQGVLRPAMKPDDELDGRDRRLILKIGRIAEQMTGLPLIHEREYRQPGEKPAALHGNSNDFAYHVLGISHYVLELGNGLSSLGLTPAQTFGDWDKYYVRNEWLPDVIEYHRRRGSEIFAPWRRFDHPQLGEVEIGGMLGGRVYYMHPELLEALAPRVAAFALRHASMGPELEIGDVEVLELGGGCLRIRAACMNVGELGTTVMAGAPGHLAHVPVRIALETAGDAEILSRPAVYEFADLEPARKVTAEWFVRAGKPEGIRIRAFHPRAGASYHDAVPES